MAEPGRRWLVFNGDADGICAAHQLRLAGLVPDRLVTGVKRDIALLDRVQALPGDSVTVADISLDANRAALEALLRAGIPVTWFDHHYAGDLPVGDGLIAHIDTGPDTCSSLIVDASLGGRFRAWAVVAAFGDNLHAPAGRAADLLALTPDEIGCLRELGELMNYNAYGESEADLHVRPAHLHARISPFADPFDFMRADGFVARLRDGFAQDMALAQAVTPLTSGAYHSLVRLPDQPWARRVNGVFANALARSAPQRAHAVAVDGAAGLTISVRAPADRPFGADALCRRFPQGGGRGRAAGINRLPQAQFAAFEIAFRDAYGSAPPNGGNQNYGSAQPDGGNQN